ncbi:hypothetical protein Pcinc_000078 [Petrolisthes cinctipes]|uniref:Ran-specific GTPase-activating protein n=1 Tax=Petrolisthes cinctipes TaxID=88211 RepID=A0AAE1EXN1_PETCI|nr:hypothetical protein Pcinc_030675 [Petrolisthes cinctipes]KAK3896257.1 hypothetical protein Pcinc_000078 [Petrolisthes cinctipes]
MAPEKTDPEEGSSSKVSEDGVEEVVVEEVGHHDPYFEPVVNLPEISVTTNEEEEEVMVKLRCKLFRYNASETPGEWKERGTGDVKILRNASKKTVRLLMRQDKTLKIRANHYITPFMELKPNCDSDRAWVWSVVADFADEEPKRECLAIKFANAENARVFKEAFYDAKGYATLEEVKRREEERELLEEEEEERSKGKIVELEEEDDKSSSKGNATEEVTKEMEKLAVKKEDAQD